MENQGTGLSVVSVIGNRRAVVDGCDGIVDYTSEKVILRTGKLTVNITGARLKLKKLTESMAIIEGLIHCVEYMR